MNENKGGKNASKKSSVLLSHPAYSVYEPVEALLKICNSVLFFRLFTNEINKQSSIEPYEQKKESKNLS